MPRLESDSAKGTRSRGKTRKTQIRIRVRVGVRGDVVDVDENDQNH